MAVDESSNRTDGIETFIINQTREDDDDRSKARKNSLVLATFILEFIILVFMVVLEYFLRWTTLFPIVRHSFSCHDPDISFRSAESGFSMFIYEGHVPDATIYALSFCVPPFVVLVGEIGVWAFTDDRQKPIWLSCNGMKVPQVVRRLVRFIGVFVFGAFTVMVFADVIKLLTGRLRPVFLEICRVNYTLCASQGGQGSDELCSQTDEMTLRYARTSFPSMYSGLSAYSAVYLTIYIHGALKTRSVRIIRPFLSLAFVMLAILCGLMEYGLRMCHWEDVAVGLAMGVVVATYFGSAILHNFREHVPEKIVLSLLHRFLLDNQILEELMKEKAEITKFRVVSAMVVMNPAEIKKRRQEYETERTQSRIRIGHEIERWRKLKEDITSASFRLSVHPNALKSTAVHVCTHAPLSECTSDRNSDKSGQLKSPKNKDLYIPRARMRRISGLEDDDTKQRARMYDHFQRDLSTTVDHFRERRNSQMDPMTPL